MFELFKDVPMGCGKLWWAFFVNVLSFHILNRGLIIHENNSCCHIVMDYLKMPDISTSWCLHCSKFNWTCEGNKTNWNMVSNKVACWYKLTLVVLWCVYLLLGVVAMHIQLMNSILKGQRKPVLVKHVNTMMSSKWPSSIRCLEILHQQLNTPQTQVKL